MKVLHPGHRYELENFENKENPGQILQFIHKEEEIIQIEDKRGDVDEYKTGNLITIADGTTNEELIEVILDRLNYLNKKFPCRENACAITNIEQGLMWLNRRTELRKKKNVEGFAKPH